MARKSLNCSTSSVGFSTNDAVLQLLAAAEGAPSSPPLSTYDRGSGPCSPTSPPTSLPLPRRKSILTRLGRFPLLAPASELASPPTFLGSPTPRRRRVGAD